MSKHFASWAKIIQLNLLTATKTVYFEKKNCFVKHIFFSTKILCTNILFRQVKFDHYWVAVEVTQNLQNYCRWALGCTLETPDLQCFAKRNGQNVLALYAPTLSNVIGEDSPIGVLLLPKGDCTEFYECFASSCDISYLRSYSEFFM